MEIEQLTYSADRWWGALDAPRTLRDAQLVLVFGDRVALEQGDYFAGLRARYANAQIVSCSSGGSIMGTHVVADPAVATALEFSASSVVAVEAELPTAESSEAVGQRLGRQLPAAGLRHVLVFAEGLAVNGSALSRGLASALPNGVSVTGGLAADGDRFERTAVGLNGPARCGRVAAVGLYGDSLSIGTGSFGGWNPFGPERIITRSEGNVLHELDGRPALELYKELLGPLGYGLPASGLLFPLKVRAETTARGLVRTILGVDEDAGTVTFAGDVPQGWSARLVRTSLDELIAAAGTAAGQTGAASTSTLALAVSCIGRKLLLQQRVDEELASVRESLGPGSHLCGFYSYGELAPSETAAPCELHNQTMTITTLSEAA